MTGVIARLSGITDPAAKRRERIPQAPIVVRDRLE